MKSGGRRAYFPALDGLRALAVIAVVAYHAGFGAARGGFLGVSVFFTLSGFLITSLLLAERDETGRLDLRAFYRRRARRLLPAAWLCVALVVLGAGLWSTAQRAELRGDALSAIGNVANWRFAFGDTSYRELLTSSPSPLAHFWSLAIEEQLYLLVPIVLVVASRWGRRWLAAVVGVLVAGSATASFLTDRFDVVYNGTHTRAAELLIGVLLAVVAGSGSGRRTMSSSWARVVVPWMAMGALSALGGAVMFVELDRPWLSDGGFVGVAVLSSVVIVGCVSDVSWFTRALSVGPLVAIGKVSYGIYLFHWPVFVAITPERVGVDGLRLHTIRAVVVAVLTIGSFVLVERPIRTERVLRRPGSTIVAAAASLVTLAAFAGMLVTPARSEADQLIALGDSGVVSFDDRSDAVSASAPSVESITGGGEAVGEPEVVVEQAAAAVVESRPVVLVAGSDRSAVEALRELDVDVVDGVQSSCPVASGVEAKMADGSIVDITGCESIVDRMARLISEVEPSVVVVSFGPLDEGLIRRRDEVGFPTEDEIAAFGARRAAAEDEIDRGVEVLLSQDAPIVLAWWGSDGLIQGSLERFDVRHSQVRAVATSDDELVGTVRPLITGQTHLLDSTAAVVAPPLRVLVTGDSTSLHLARALHDASTELDVLWAGRNGCPFVRARALRTTARVDVTELACDDFAEVLPPLIDSFDPEVVLLMVGPTELTEQFYGDDPDGHVPGSSEWVAFHDSEMVDFLRAVGEHVPVMIADAPPIVPGTFSTGAMAQPERLAALNAQIDRWVAKHERLELLAYAAPLAAAEDASGSIRPDGVHADIDALTDLAREWLVGQIVAVAQ